MRRIPLGYASPGMIIAKNIYNGDGRVLLAAGMTLTSSYLSRLEKLGVPSLYIKDESIGELDIPEPVSEKTRIATVKTLKETFYQLETARKLDVDRIKGTVNQIIDEIVANQDIMVNLVDIRTQDDYTFAHSVNVCILSIMTGISLHYNSLQLRDLAVGAILHDIGKTQIPKSILNKPEKLTPAEYNLVQEHTTAGFEILRTYREISLLSAHVAFQHHERLNGQGYPRGLKDNEIHEYARIVAVADAYDALTADRPYRQGFHPAEAMRIMCEGSAKEFDARIVAALLENVAVYPVGSLVQLNTGEIGMVIDVNRDAQTRPIIKILLDRFNQPATKHQEIDLDKFSTVYIVRAFSEEQSYFLIKQLREGLKLSNVRE